jgi:hypothetical protein
MKCRNVDLYRYAAGIIAAGILLNPLTLIVLILRLSG